MNNYNQSLAEVATANQTLEQQILRSKQQGSGEDPIASKITEVSQMVGGEFTKSGFDTIAKNLTAKTGLQSLQNLGKNIKAKGVVGGVTKTATEAQQEVIQKVQSKVKDVAGQAQSKVEDVAGQAQSKLEDVAGQAQGKLGQAQDALDDASSAWKNHPLYDAGQKTRLNLANRENLNKGKAPLSEGDKNLSPEDLRSKMDSMDSEISKPLPSALDLVNKSRVARGEQPLKKLLTKDELAQQAEDLKSKSKSAAEDVAGEAGEAEEEGTSAVRSGASQAGTGLAGDSLIARLGLAPSSQVSGGVPQTPEPEPQLAQQQPEAPGAPTPPEPAASVTPPAAAKPNTETPEDDDTPPPDPLNDPGVQGTEAIAGLADPLVGAAEAGIGILGMLLPDLFGGDDNTPAPQAPVGDILSQTSNMGLGN